MKTKNSYPFIQTFIAAAVSIIILLPLRIYQYFTILEADTGFYSKKDFSVYLMYAVIAFIVIFSIAVAFINRKKLKLKKVTFSPVGGTLVYALSVAGFISDAVSCITNYISIGNDYSFNYDQTKWSFISERGGVIIIAEAVLAIVSAVYFISMACSCITKTNVGPKLRIIALALPLWGVARLLIRFKTKISFVNVSDLFIGLIAITLTMLYLLYFVQTVSEVDNGESYYKMFAYGIPASVFSLTCFVPRFLLTIIGRNDLICEGYGVELCDLLIPIMIIATLISRSYDLKSKK